jgi:hypothetical protein
MYYSNDDTLFEKPALCSLVDIPGVNDKIPCRGFVNPTAAGKKPEPMIE